MGKSRKLRKRFFALGFLSIVLGFCFSGLFHFCVKTNSLGDLGLALHLCAIAILGLGVFYSIDREIKIIKDWWRLIERRRSEFNAAVLCLSCAMFVLLFLFGVIFPWI